MAGQGLAAALLLCSALGWAGRAGAQEAADSFYEAPGVLASEILRARGFLAHEHHFTTPDGYTIRLTRGRNPLFGEGRARGGLANRVPILFVHGILESDNVFLINSFQVRPKDLANASLSESALAEEPAAKSLPLLALQLGHEVWLMSRRGFSGSSELQRAEGKAARRSPLAGLLGLGAGLGSFAQQVALSLDRRFWNFSFDEQARYDLPLAIDFVLEHTGRRRLSLVSHSAGGAIELMALSLYPELADKLESSILWSQGFSLGHGDAFSRMLALRPLLEAYVGPVPPTFSTGPIQAIGGLLCAGRLAQTGLCEALADLLLGASAGQQPIRPEFVNSLLYPSASHELAQNLQMVPFGQMRAYNCGPLYNASNIRLETMSFYVGATDTLVTPADVRATLPLLRVPYKFHLIDTAFNHNGYFYHNDNARLAVIPSLREIQQFSLQRLRRS